MKERAELDKVAELLKARVAAGEVLDPRTEALQLRRSGHSVIETMVILVTGLGVRLGDAKELMIGLDAPGENPFWRDDEPPGSVRTDHFRDGFGPVTEAEARQKWQASIDRYEGIDAPHTRFNVTLLRALRPNWKHRVRPDTSMFTVFFTRHGITADRGDERVRIDWESDERVNVSLERLTARRGESRKLGHLVVAGDIVRPENAVPVVESLLMQLAGPMTRRQRVQRALRPTLRRPRSASRSRFRGDQA